MYIIFKYTNFIDQFCMIVQKHSTVIVLLDQHYLSMYGCVGWTLIIYYMYNDSDHYDQKVYIPFFKYSNINFNYHYKKGIEEYILFSFPSIRWFVYFFFPNLCDIFQFLVCPYRIIFFFVFKNNLILKFLILLLMG